MSFLHRFFADDITLAREIARDEERLETSLRDMQVSCARKMDAVRRLREGAPLKEHLPKLWGELEHELRLIDGEVRDAQEIVAELKGFKVKGFLAELRATLDHDLSQERYCVKLLEHLERSLKEQASAVHHLMVGDDADLRRRLLPRMLLVEDQILKEFAKRPSLRKTYRDLVELMRDEHIVRAHEREFADNVFTRVRDSEPDAGGRLRARSRDGVTLFAAHCLNGVWEHAERLFAAGELGNHPHAMYEFVNSTLFKEYVVREAMRHVTLRVDASRTVSDPQFLRIFTIVFRDLFNSNIER